MFSTSAVVLVKPRTQYFSHTEVLIIKMYRKKVLIPPNPTVIINDGIPRDLCSLSYIMVNTAIRHIASSGHGTLMGSKL